MSDSHAWYKNGLQFACTQCGNCCTGEPGMVWIDDNELQQIADYLEVSIGEIRLLHARPVGLRLSLREHANGDCTFFDGETRRCRIYPVRPRQCRSWPFWTSNLETPEAWSRTQIECPGAGQGDFISLDEVERRAAMIDI